MLNRPDYKWLVKRVRAAIEQQKASNLRLVAITTGVYAGLYRGKALRDFEESWPKVLNELGLIDDGTHTGTYTVPGHGFHDVFKR